jgi:hypothetical protein
MYTIMKLVTKTFFNKQELSLLRY